MSNIADKIRIRRNELGIKINDLADAAGISKTTLYRAVSDPSVIPVKKLDALAAALQTTPEWLLGKTDMVDIPPVSELDSDADDHKTKRIPLLGRISAGLPLYAEENIDGYILSDYGGNDEYFALRVSGDSMTAARIYDGDILIVRRTDYVDNGRIAVVLVDDDAATVKRFYQKGNLVTLMPQSNNPIHQPQVYDIKKTRIRIQGQVVQVQFPAN